MTSTNRMTTIAATALLAGLLSAAPASATHIVGHTANAVKQDVKDLGERAAGHAQDARETAEQAGAQTRREVQAIADERVRSTARTVRDTRTTAAREAAQQAEKLKQRSQNSQRAAQRRVTPAQNSARQVAGRAASAGRSGISRTGAAAQQTVDRGGSIAARVLGEIEARMWMLVGPAHGKLAAILEGGSVVASLTGSGTYSAGWTRTGGCWSMRVGTPLNLPGSRQRRRTGTTVEPMRGHRSTVDASGGGASASTGC